MQEKYTEICKNEVRFEEIQTEDAEYLLVAYGLSARISHKTLELASEKGLKVGLLRPITLYPFPYERINKLADKLKGILTVELNAGQMIEDVRLAVEGKTKVAHYGRMGGIIPGTGRNFREFRINYEGEVKCQKKLYQKKTKPKTL